MHIFKYDQIKRFSVRGCGLLYTLLWQLGDLVIEIETCVLDSMQTQEEKKTTCTLKNLQTKYIPQMQDLDRVTHRWVSEQQEGGMHS